MMEPNFRLVDIRNTSTIAQKRCVSRYYDEIMIMIMIMIMITVMIMIASRPPRGT